VSTDTDTRGLIGEFVRRFLGADFGDGEDIFGSGKVQSMFALELVTFLEGTFAIHVENDDLDLDNFRSVDALAEFVARKRAPGAGAGA
jgi:acyl carrier protein